MSPDQYTNVPSLCLSCNVYFLGDFVFFEFFHLFSIVTCIVFSSRNRICVIWNKIDALQRVTVFFLCHAKKSFFICANLNLLLDEIFAILPVLCKFFF